MTQEELQKALEAIGKSGITVNGDLVLSKHVEHEVGNVEAGGIGIQIVNGEGSSQIDNSIKCDAKQEEGTRLPDELTTAEANCLLGKLAKNGMVDEHWQPKNLSNAEKGVLAKYLGEKLSVCHIWQVFGGLWGMKTETIRSAYNKALGQRKTLAFQDKLKKILG